MAEKSPRPRRPLASRTDVSSGARYRDCVQSPRPSRKQSNPDAFNSRKHRQHVASAIVDPEPTQNNSPEVRHIPFATTAVDLARAHPCRCPVGPQTMLTVLTQEPPFLSRNWRVTHRRPCKSPSVLGRKRRRMHGGALGSGTPRGNKNALKHGRFTHEAIAERGHIRELVRQARKLLLQMAAPGRAEASIQRPDGFSSFASHRQASSPGPLGRHVHSTIAYVQTDAYFAGFTVGEVNACSRAFCILSTVEKFPFTNSFILLDR